ncbi:hypothetical protein NO2_1742, partial [Candidatus Termititenax persephonae]
QTTLATALTEENKKLNADLQFLRNETADKSEQLSRQADKINELQSALQEQTTLAADRDEENKKAVAELQRLCHENTGLTKNIDKITEHEVDLLKQLEYIKNTNVLITKENTALKGDKRLSEVRIAELDETIQKLVNEKKSLVEAREVAVQEMNRTISSFSAEQEKNIKLEYRFKRAEQEFREIQNELQETKNVLTAVESLVAPGGRNKTLLPDKN